jgi:hypothetical protein
VRPQSRQQISGIDRRLVHARDCRARFRYGHVATAGIIAYLVGFIIVVSSERRRRLGDMAAGTLVVRG